MRAPNVSLLSLLETTDDIWLSYMHQPIKVVVVDNASDK